jgi:hypothetical protein
MTLLQIAALFGYDPTDPARLVDLLVIQGRHPDAEAASAALRAAGAPAPGADGHHVWPNPFTALRRALRQAPGMIGMRFNAFRRGGPVNATLSVAKVASYLVPVVGIRHGPSTRPGPQGSWGATPSISTLSGRDRTPLTASPK